MFKQKVFVRFKVKFKKRLAFYYLYFVQFSAASLKPD